MFVCVDLHPTQAMYSDLDKCDRQRRMERVRRADCETVWTWYARALDTFKDVLTPECLGAVRADMGL